jgi:hypothetical protein
MIRHEHIRVHGTAAAICRLTQAFKIKTSIDIAKKARGAIDPTLDDMKRNPRKL